MLSLNKCISNIDIELILKNSSQNIDSLNPLYAGKIGQGRLDAHEALVMTTAHLGDLTLSSALVDGCTANDVSISVSFVGGQAPHDVIWSNGANSLSLDSLGFGSNQITITDAHGCSVNQVFNVVDVQEPILNSQVTNVACFGDSSGQIELLFTNPQEITNITWNNGQSGTVLSNLSVGTYEATISYNNGLCSIMQSELVQSPNVLSIAALITDIDSINAGAIDVTVSGGTPPYLYNWDNNQQTEDLSNLIAGVYSISVTDSAGCSLAAFYEISEDTTGQSDGLDEVDYFNIHAYPNPSNGDVTISWSGELISLELISALGQVISKQYSFPTNTKLLKNLNSGVYFVRYTKNQTTSKTIKLVVL
jgi:hypothetical protein